MNLVAPSSQSDRHPKPGLSLQTVQGIQKRKSNRHVFAWFLSFSLRLVPLSSLSLVLVLVFLEPRGDRIGDSEPAKP